MQLKEEFRTYEALRREHDSQIVQIAMEGGLRIAPDQWSSLLYGDQSHKSHMQSIIDKVCNVSLLLFILYSHVRNPVFHKSTEALTFFLLPAQLQTPASFAQSVQELTIALQRTGDPANLNRLRPHLELLANIDPSPGKKLHPQCQHTSGILFFSFLRSKSITGSVTSWNPNNDLSSHTFCVIPVYLINTLG